ncbi:hypothetical protein CLOM_g1650 [Closterium sp. NIES-68]|nr:hypothetical protein CLOM_g1650 [Closterium sp. NIES-68]
MLFLAVPNTDPTVDLGANGVLGLPLLDSTRQMKEFPLFASAHPASAPSASASANASAMAGAPAPPESATKAEAFASLSILLQIAMLMVAFVVGHILRRRKVYYIHEGSAALLIGLFVGSVGNWRGTQESFREWLGFKEEIFLLFLLPPIIFESGFSLQVKPFFNNFGAIVTFACLGTFLSAIVTGVLVYVGGFLFLMYKLSFLEALIFGALISSTDPVAILAIFQDVGADTNLYALVFGESVLNDAVAITMFRTVMTIIRNPAADPSISAAFQYAVITFAGSTSIGVGVSLFSALLFKYAGLSVKNLHNLECCLIVLFPYISYLVAEGLALSGIVAILFCGILMKRYTFPNLSEMAQVLSAGFFQLIASIAETFTFIYMGTEIALGEHQRWGHISFILFSILIICVARAANVFPCAHLINLFRPPSKQIPESHQKALWFSGLRGAMAFGLALQATHDLPNHGHGRAIFTTTTAIVMLTVILLGGSTSTVLERLRVTGDRYSQLRQPEDTSDEEGEEGSAMTHGLIHGHVDGRDHGVGKAVHGGTHLDQHHLSILPENPSFEDLDSKYIRPFFTAEHAPDTSWEGGAGSREGARGREKGREEGRGKGREEVEVEVAVEVVVVVLAAL